MKERKGRSLFFIGSLYYTNLCRGWYMQVAGGGSVEASGRYFLGCSTAKMLVLMMLMNSRYKYGISYLQLRSLRVLCSYWYPRSL